MSAARFLRDYWQKRPLLVRNAFMSVDPSMRGRLEETEKHYTTNFSVGEPLDGSAVGRVVPHYATPSRPGVALTFRRNAAKAGSPSSYTSRRLFASRGCIAAQRSQHHGHSGRVGNIGLGAR